MMQQDFNFTGEKTGEKSRQLNALRILRGLGSVQGFRRGFFLHFNCVSGVLVTQLCSTLCDPMDLVYQDPLVVEFSRQEYWGGFPFLSAGNLLTQ